MQACLGVIPARGGSKGVPRKNIRLVAGKPLISYAIEAAQGSQLLSHFVVSTDDSEIAKVAQRLGAPVVLRPPELAADDTPMVAVVEHVLAQVTEPPTYVALLQPTAPLRTAHDIDSALLLLDQSDADCVVSVYEVGDHHPSRMYLLVDGRLVPYEKEPAARLRQALPPVYHRNGAIYACRPNLVTEHGTLIGCNIVPYIMPRERSINIDDEIDLLLADLLLTQQAEWARG